jgi:hypothetical protein
VRRRAAYNRGVASAKEIPTYRPFGTQIAFAVRTIRKAIDRRRGRNASSVITRQ